MLSSNSLYEARVIVANRNRTPATEVIHQGQTYIEGREGSEYILVFTNKTAIPVLVLPSVDGLSVLDGKPASFQSPGYVVGALQTVEIPGWKVDASTAAKFVFARKGNRSTDPAKRTYAEQLGTDPRNIGVIGFAVFSQKVVYQQTCYTLTSQNPDLNSWPYYGGTAVPPPLANPTWHASTAAFDSVHYLSTLQNMALGASAIPNNPRSASDFPKGIASSSAVGTGFGEATQFKTTEAKFERANPDSPDAVLSLVYDSIGNLERMGVPVADFRPKSSGSRNPFPAQTTGCPIPGGWKK